MNKEIVILALHLSTGGAERVICNLANLLSEKNNVKIISTYRLNEKPSFNLNDNIKVQYLVKDLKPNKYELKRALKSFNPILLFKELSKSIKILYLRKSLMIKEIRKLNCDIVISTRVLYNNWIGKYTNKNIIKIAQEHNHHNNNQKYIKKVINSLKGFNYFMPVSQELANFYNKKLDNTKVLYIPNFIEKFSNNNSNLSNHQLVSVGRLDTVKGFSDLIDIFKIFSQNHEDWTLHIVGDGPEKQNLQNKINKLHLQNKICLCGTKLSDELEKEYLNSSVYLMTSFSESFGLVLIEAASYGLPLIAFDSAQGAHEIIENNKNGFLIKNRNQKDFIEKLNEIIENDKLKNKFSENSINTAKKYSKENISKIWDEFINNL